ncbi:MAG: type II secretion system protein [Sedimentisphaerales bacterium]
MKPITKQSERCVSGKKAAFTIVELLTVMSIIVILIGLLVPSLNMAKRYAKEVKQKALFHSIDAAMELFNSDWEGYPPSSAKDEIGDDYCGAMKLCEALVGQDLMGFHPNSRFRADCTDGAGHQLYDNPPTGTALDPNTRDNLKARKGPYLQTENANAYRLSQLYGATTTPFKKDLFVLCDVYSNVKNQDTGRKIGMPILYYKANTSNTIHDPNGTFPTVGDDKKYIYNYTDNDNLVKLGPPPWDAAGTDTHPLYGPTTNFYDITRDKRISIQNGRPYRPDSYILISAGYDGMYGTKDDVFNF